MGRGELAFPPSTPTTDWYKNKVFFVLNEFPGNQALPRYWNTLPFRGWNEGFGRWRYLPGISTLLPGVSIVEVAVEDRGANFWWAKEVPWHPRWCSPVCIAAQTFQQLP